jgi:hypothetical protein
MPTFVAVNAIRRGVISDRRAKSRQMHMTQRVYRFTVNSGFDLFTMALLLLP